MPTILARNRYARGDALANATMQLLPAERGPGTSGPQELSVETNRWGQARIDPKRLADGLYQLRLWATSSTADVGPNLPPPGVSATRIWRPLECHLNVRRSRILSAIKTSRWGNVTVGGGADLVLEAQPVWIESPFSHDRNSTAIDTIVIHSTKSMSSAINWFLASKANTDQVAAHYLIDRDGAIVKMVRDANRANHAGAGGSWKGDKNLNSRSVGIEVINPDDGKEAYTEAQYESLLSLIERIRDKHPVVPQRIIGHVDTVTLDDKGRLRRTDPGLMFDWPRLEAKGLAPPRTGTAPDKKTLCGGYFDQTGASAFQNGDADSAQKFGGKIHKEIASGPIKELQTDLQTIGYNTGGTADGKFGQGTHMAVYCFQVHFFAGGRGHKTPDGKVDQKSAELIKQVRG